MGQWTAICDEAARIAKLQTRDERRAALASLPVEQQGHVRELVNSTLSLAAYWTRELERGYPRERLPSRVWAMLDGLGVLTLPPRPRRSTALVEPPAGP